jgi:hypothetical protein
VELYLFSPLRLYGVERGGKYFYIIVNGGPRKRVSMSSIMAGIEK